MANTSHGKSEWKGKEHGGATGVVETAEDFAGKAKDAAVDMAGNIADKARDMGSSVVKGAGNVASYVGRKAEDATSAMGSGIQSLGETIRDKGPQAGVLGSATSAVAGGLESTGEYLKEHGLSGIGEDLTGMIRRNPIPALLLGIGVGYLIARATRR